jgi:hypothetical protein
MVILTLDPSYAIFRARFAGIAVIPEETYAKGVVSKLCLDCSIVNPSISGPGLAGPDTTPHVVRLLQRSSRRDAGN